jgi:hypothetical protein
MPAGRKETNYRTPKQPCCIHFTYSVVSIMQRCKLTLPSDGDNLKSAIRNIGAFNVHFRVEMEAAAITI